MTATQFLLKSVLIFVLSLFSMAAQAQQPMAHEEVIKAINGADEQSIFDLTVQRAETDQEWRDFLAKDYTNRAHKLEANFDRALAESKKPSGLIVNDILKTTPEDQYVDLGQTITEIRSINKTRAQSLIQQTQTNLQKAAEAKWGMNVPPRQTKQMFIGKKAALDFMAKAKDIGVKVTSLDIRAFVNVGKEAGTILKESRGKIATVAVFAVGATTLATFNPSAASAAAMGDHNDPSSRLDITKLELSDDIDMKSSSREKVGRDGSH